MPVRGYKGFLAAAQLCPFPGCAPAAGAAQREGAHPGSVPHSPAFTSLIQQQGDQGLGVCFG